MKKLFFMATLLVALFASCSSDDDERVETSGKSSLPEVIWKAIDGNKDPSSEINIRYNTGTGESEISYSKTPSLPELIEKAIDGSEDSSAEIYIRYNRSTGESDILYGDSGEMNAGSLLSI